MYVAGKSHATWLADQKTSGLFSFDENFTVNTL